MTVIEIISAFLLIIACIFVVAVVLMQESKKGMSNVITGGSSDNYYQKNSGRTREAKLSKATRTAAIAIFVIALAVNVITIHFGGAKEEVVDSSLVDDLDITFETTDGSENADVADDAAETTATEATVAEETAVAE